MSVKLITRNWARTLRTKRIAMRCANVPIGSGQPFWMSTFRHGLVIASNKIIQTIQEKLDFGKRFFRKTAEAMLESLDLILVKRIFRLLKNNVLNSFVQINLSFRPSSQSINVCSNNLITENIKDILYISRSCESAQQQAAWHQAASIICLAPTGSRLSGVGALVPSKRLTANGLSLMPTDLAVSSGLSKPEKGFFDSIAVRENRGEKFQVQKPELQKIMQTECHYIGETLHSFRTKTRTDMLRSLRTEMMKSRHFQQLRLKNKSSTTKEKIINLIHRHSHDIYRSGRTPAVRLFTSNVQPSAANRRMSIKLTYTKRYQDQHEVLHRVHSMSYPVCSEFITRKIQGVDTKANQKDIEKVVFEKIFKTLDKTIKERVYRELKSDSNYTRQFTENVFSQLFNRIVLERERLGVI
jgi:hypothetical protein